VLGVLVWQLEDRQPPAPLVRPEDRYRYAPDEGQVAPRAPREGSAGETEKSRAGARAFDDGIGVGAGERLTDRAYITDRYRRVRVLDTISIYYDDRPGLLRAGVDLDQYWRPYPDRRRSDPFPEDGYPGVRIPD